MKEECLICSAPLEYLETDILMECAICHKKENSKTRCVNGHYVCTDCHTQGLDSIIAVCLEETSKNPVEIIEKMMAMPFCHMHGPEHHVMVGSALLTAYKNAGGSIDLHGALIEMMNRGKRAAFPNTLIILRRIPANHFRLFHRNAKMIFHKVNRGKNGKKRISFTATRAADFPYLSESF